MSCLLRIQDPQGRCTLCSIKSWTVSVPCSIPYRHHISQPVSVPRDYSVLLFQQWTTVWAGLSVVSWAFGHHAASWGMDRTGWASLALCRSPWWTCTLSSSGRVHGLSTRYWWRPQMGYMLPLTLEDTNTAAFHRSSPDTLNPLRDLRGVTKSQQKRDQPQDQCGL